MPFQTLMLFFLASLVAAVMPGPDILTVITRSVTQGKWAGWVATLGFATGLIAHTTAAALGLALILQQSPKALLAIRLAGVAYLLYLAARMVMAKDPIAIDAQGKEGESRLPLRRIFAQSVLMNILNPKVTMFFLALLPLSVNPEWSLPVPAQFVVLGALFALATLVVFGSCALLASTLSAGIRRRPGAGRPLRIATAILFVAIAVWLAAP